MVENLSPLNGLLRSMWQHRASLATCLFKLLKNIQYRTCGFLYMDNLSRCVCANLTSAVRNYPIRLVNIFKSK